jgi:multiple sugar transport system substrate-binding protein
MNHNSFRTNRSVWLGINLLVLTIVMTFSLLSCQQGGNDRTVDLSEIDNVTITFYNYNQGSPIFGRGTDMLIDEFHALHPNIRIEGIAIPSPDINARVQAEIVAGTPPDIAQLVFDGLDYFVNHFNAKPLEQIASAEDLRQHFEGFSEPGRKLTQINGLTYGLPFTFSTPMLFYNATIFRAVGLDPDRPPRTWDEVKQYALRIVDRTGKEGFYPATYSQAFDWLTQSIVKSNGGRVLSEDRSRIMFGEPAAVESIQMLRDLRESGAHSSLAAGEVTEAMYRGNLGMILNTSALQSFLITNAQANNWELRAAAMPSFGNRPTTPVNSGSALFIFSDDPIKQAAAWEFLKFVTSERGYTIITSEIGYLPLRPSIVDDPRYLKDWVAANPLVQPNLEQLTRLTAWESYPGQNWKQIELLFQAALEQAVYGNGSVAEIMADAQRRAQELMPRR